MKKILFALPALLIFLALGNNPVLAQSESGYYSVSDLPSQDLLTPEEVDDLVAPIALYPDPLIAQILPASTFIEQIDEAARYVRQYGRNARIDDQLWDLSVKAVAHYPDLLFMMDQKYDWTVALGQAYLDQPQDVMDSIQVLRAEARDQGNLVSTAQQQVIVESDGDIRIVPAAPEYIYVPVYDPQVVYYQPSPGYGFITFGAGFAIGAWLSRDMDWRDHRVYYHGWREGGWVGRSRPHIQDRRGIYINKRAAQIGTSRRVLQRDTSRFRQDLRQDAERHRELPGRPAPQSRPERPRQGRGDQQRPGRTDQQRPPRSEQPRTGDGQHAPPASGQRPPAAAGQPAPAAPGRGPAAGGQHAPAAAGQHAPATGQHAPAATGQQAPPAAGPRPAATGSPESRPGMRDVFRGRDVQNAQPASRSGYGGYGSSKDAETYRERGQSSRERMRQGGSPAPPPQPSAAPAPKPAAAPAAPASRPAAAPVPRPHVPRPVAPAPQPAAPPAPRPATPPHEQR